MKITNYKLFLILFLWVVFSFKAISVPAYPHPFKYTQPDGSTITVLIKGDEFLKWKETVDGYTLLYNTKGELEYAVLDNQSNLVPSGIVAQDIEKRDSKHITLLTKTPKKLFFNKTQINVSKQLRAIRDAQMTKMQKAPGSTNASNSTNAFPKTGNPKLICILMGFKDKAFTLSKTDFNNLFNQINYSDFGATGSVKDFYLENSYNQFNLTVDVAGPYTAANNMSYYGGNDASGNDLNPDKLVEEAVTFADPTINFADYDNDHNGVVDGVYVIFAGYGEEAGGGNNPNAIWSHASAINKTADGVTVSSYSCSPELRGNSGTNITRIGVICHEFGHVLGAPDYYDTDYTTGGQYDGTGEWDLMAGGSWNGYDYDGATPAHHNGWTKTMIYHWANTTILNSPQNITLADAETHANSFYKINTNTPGEYYFLENREQNKFDTYTPGRGMLIYHVLSNVMTGKANNNINNTFPLEMYPVAQNATQDPTGLGTYGTINSSTCPWNGTGKTEFSDASLPSSKSFAGDNTNKPITAISRNSTNKTVSFAFMGGNSCTIPTTQASNFTTSGIQNNQLTVNWTRGTGDKVLVVAHLGTSVDETPSGSDFTASSTFGSGKEIGSGNYIVYNGTGNSVTVTGLFQGTKYYFAIYEYNSADNCVLTPALTGSETTTGTPYCTPTAANDDITGITNVTFNTIDNNSDGTPAYSDYREITTTVEKGRSYSLSVNVNTGGNYTVKTKAWIDWNGDGSFDATTEEYNLGNATNVTDGITSISPIIVIPTSTANGLKIMRVRTIYYDNVNLPTACGGIDYSEAEDYTLNVIDKFIYTSTTNKVDLQSFNVYSNTNKQIIIESNTEISNARICISNAIGQKLYSTDSVKKYNLINKSFSPGIYLVTINESGKTTTKKIIIN